MELLPHNIRVNVIGPGGPTATPGFLKHRPDEPLDKLLKPSIIRPLAVYLASDDSTGVTGQSFRAKIWNADQKWIQAANSPEGVKHLLLSKE